MNSDYLQHIRHKLDKRLQRLTSATREAIRGTLHQTWAFFQGDEIIKGILDDLEARVPEAKTLVGSVISGPRRAVGETELANAAIAYWVVKTCATTPLSETVQQHGNVLLEMMEYRGENTRRFQREYVEPLFDYIEEQIDDRRMVLVLLKKYKHRCEWFRREHLLTDFQANTQQGEKTLALDLYGYLHDQGIQFHIEPHSASGCPDLISAQAGPDRLVADTKLFNPKSGQDRSYLIKGFRQVYDYTKDYNEPFGYLVVFKTCEHDLSIPTPRQESGVPFITHNNKTIFILIIDLVDYPESASKRGKLSSYEITPEQFVESLTSPPPDSAPPTA